MSFHLGDDDVFVFIIPEVYIYTMGIKIHTNTNKYTSIKLYTTYYYIHFINHKRMLPKTS